MVFSIFILEFNFIIMIMGKRIYIFIIIFFTFLGVFAQTTDSTEYIDPSPLNFNIYENTSLIKLIANPEKYDGQMIQVVGYLHLEFEGNALYFHQEDYQNRIYENSFWVNFSDKLRKGKNIMNYNNHYVYIIGKFKMNHKGHMGLFGGTIDNIVRLNFKKSQ